MTTNSATVATSGQTPSATNCGASSATICSNQISSSLTSLNQLPTELLTNKDLFVSLFSGCDSVWHQLDDNKRNDLINNYLPKGLSKGDKQKTIELLMNGSLKRFNSDLLSQTFVSLKFHKLSPDLAKALEDVKTLKRKLFRIYEQKRQSLLLEEVIEKRRHAFDKSIQTSIRSEDIVNHSVRPESDPLRQRVRLRYQKEVKDISPESDISTDEEDSKSVFDKCLSLKMNGNQLSPIGDKQYYEMLRKHRRKRKLKELDNRYEPTLDTQSITLSDIISRVTNPTLTTKLNSGSVDERKKSIPSSHSSLKSSSIATPKKKAKHTNTNKTVQTVPPIQPKILPQISPSAIKIEKERTIKSEVKIEPNICDIKVENSDRLLSSTNKPNVCAVKSTPAVSKVAEPECPIIAAPLPAIPVLLPSAVSVTPAEPSPVPVTPTVPIENAPKCFFSLLRDVFMANASNDRRLSLHKLEELVKDKLRTFSPFLGWSTEMVASAMNYLSGVLPPPHLVPLVDYKEKNQQWQWIGDGRDRDQLLVPLCDQWMKNKDEDPTASLVTFSQALPPPAKCLTDWVVRPSSDEEKEVYRSQEAVRYQNPYKAFTYKVHGYESVVGPVKGCGIGAANGHNNSSPNKAREHSLLVNDRPPFVTLLSLVRDAAARLPNGEGTRADICELLKDSQYLLPTISDQQVNGIVSGALDRLHYEKDPCVKYDVNRKVWIYLHRNRTEAEFERLHEVQIAAAKAKRSMSKASRKTNCVPAVPNNQSCQTRQLSIISKTTQQAIHQAVNNILNSEALKITKSIDSSTEIIDNHMKGSSNESANTNEGLISDLKTSLVTKINKDKPLTSFNGTASSPLTANPLFVSLQSNNQLRCKPEPLTTSTVQIPLLDKKKATKPKENKLIEPNRMVKASDNKQSIIESSVQTSSNSLIAPPALSLSIAADDLASSEKTKLVANESNSAKIINKTTRNIKQTKPSIKVQIPKTITLPISISSQNSLKGQTSTVSVPSENLPALISLTNAGAKTITPTPTTQTRPLTKIVSATPLNSSSATAPTGNQMHQISIPTSVLFGARPGSVVLATSTGKSYMMAATGGQIVLQPNSSSTAMNNSSDTSPQPQSLAVRTLQGIRVIPVNPNPNPSSKVSTPITAKGNTSGTPVVMATQTQPFNSSAIPPHHQFVARIITTSQANRGNIPQTQIVIPSTSALQPLFLTHPSAANTGANLVSATNSVTTTTARAPNEVKLCVSQSLPPRTTSS